MTCQRRGIALACIVLCAALPPFAVVGAADRPADKTVKSSGATARAAPAANPPARTAGPPASATPGSPPMPPIPVSGDQVLAHIKQTLAWYRESQELVQVPQLTTDVVERDQLRVTALTGLRLAFDVGRAAATAPAGTAPEASQPSTGGSKPGAAGSGTGNPQPATTHSQQSLNEANARIADRITQLQSQLATLDARLARASARSRTGIRAQRDQLAAALALEREVQTTIGNLQRFQSSTFALQASGSKDLLGQIADLERTVPELRQAASGQRGPAAGSQGSAGAGQPAGAQSGGASGTGGAQSGGAAAQPAVTFHPESAGIIALIEQWISLQSADGRIDDMAKSTNDLGKELDHLRTPLVTEARSLAREVTVGVDSTDLAAIQSSRQMLEEAAARYRQLSAVLVPLGNQDFVLENTQAALSEWTGALGARIRDVARNLLIRVVILATLIAAVLVVSEVSRRAVYKYLHDSRRRSQFQTLRRVIVGALLAMVIFFALVSQLGSLATYIGFLTAGLAVALQTVILSIVAYFFFIGRYGVRVGDRITLSGVTGRVVDIGLIRIYLMELAGADLHSTGRIVVLSNSVLFQPQALFKQIPGAEYLWHTISLTLAPTADAQAAQQELQKAADEAFEHYRSVIDTQHAAVRRLVDFDTGTPSPEVRVRFAEQGWQFDVRYPVHAEQAASIDQRMLKAIRAAVADSEHFPVVDSAAPALKAEAN